MKATKVEFTDRPIALYNADKQELIGVFSTVTLASKYLRPDQPQNSYAMVFDALKRAGSVRKTIFDFKVAVRFANESQAFLLTGEKSIIVNGYPEFEQHKQKGFNTSRADLYKLVLMGKGFQKAK